MNCASSSGSVAFQRSLSFVPMMSSLTSGLARRCTWLNLGPIARPRMVRVGRLVNAYAPSFGDAVSSAPVPVVVDSERVLDVRVEREVVGARTGLGAGEHVHHKHDLLALAGLIAAEHEEVRDVRWGVQ